MTVRTAAFCALALLGTAGGFGACGGTSGPLDHAGGAPGSASGAGGAGGAGGGGGVGGAGGTATAGCSAPASATCVQPAPSFAATITPILDRSCNTCHSDDNPDGIWPLRAWADVSAWQQLIISDLVNCTMPPPDSNTSFPESDRQLLFAWLACSSPDN